MSQNKYLYLIPFFIILISSLGYTQFVDLNAELDLRRLSEGDRQLFSNLEENIENYLLNTQFSAEANDLEIVINIRLIIESVSSTSSQTTISAQAIFSNKSDQYFYAKSVQFPYSKGQKMYFTTSFNPLSSFLDYYAFMFIATELDTWEYMGGTSFYNKANEIANLGKDSDWSSGWDDRWKKNRTIKNNEYLRSMRFNYFTALDELRTEDVDMQMVNNSMVTFYDDLILLDKKLGSNKEALQFLKAYKENIAELLSILNLKDALIFLKDYDHDHKEIYESYLKN
tara:strand:+ start:1357 stop:2208 length:852 start_codon:yes stop_codon:yes gene_type:complete